MQRDAGVCGGKGGHAAGQPVRRDRLAGRDAQIAPLQPGQIVQHAQRIGRLRQHSARLGQEGASRVVQFQPAPHAIEQARGVAFLQRGNGGADGGLRQVQALRRRAHVQRFGNGHENAQLFECHAAAVIRA